MNFMPPKIKLPMGSLPKFLESKAKIFDSIFQKGEIQL